MDKPSAPVVDEYGTINHQNNNLDRYQSSGIDMERMTPLLAQSDTIITNNSSSSSSSSSQASKKRVFHGHRHFSESEKEEVICRCCQGGLEDGEDLIAPCACTGSIQFVHRHCLDTWRTVSTNPNSFYRCDICHSNYVFEQERDEESSRSRFEVGCSYLKYTLFVSMDISLIVFVWQVLVVLCAVFVHFVDFDRARMKKFRPGASVLGVDYLCGHLLFFFLLGVLGIFVAFAWAVMKCLGIRRSDFSTSDEQGGGSSSYTYDTYPYRRYSHYQYSTWDYFALYFCWFNFYTPYPVPYNPSPYHPASSADCCACLPSTCDCHGCCDGSGLSLDCGSMNCSGGSSDDGGAIGVLLAILLVVVIIVILIGVFIGMGLTMYLIYNIVKKRHSLIKRRDDVIRYVVADLEAY